MKMSMKMTTVMAMMTVWSGHDGHTDHSGDDADDDDDERLESSFLILFATLPVRIFFFQVGHLAGS